MKRIKFMGEIAEIKDQENFAEGTTDMGRTEVSRKTGVNTIMCDKLSMDKDRVTSAQLHTIAKL
jgi:hypothetical protein